MSCGALAFLNIDLDIVMQTIGVIAKVVWCEKINGSYRIGLSFSWWPKYKDKQLLFEFIKSNTSCEELLYKNGNGNVKSV